MNQDKVVPDLSHREILQGFLSTDKFISVNRRLARKRGGYTLSKEYRHEEWQLEMSMEASGLVRGCLAGLDCYFSLEMVFFLKENFSRRDLDNELKNPVDVISRYLGFNDNRIVSYKIAKRKLDNIPGDEPQKEWVYFKIKQVNKKVDDVSIDYKDFKEFVRQNTGREIFYKLTNKLEDLKDG